MTDFPKFKKTEKTYVEPTHRIYAGYGTEPLTPIDHNKDIYKQVAEGIASEAHLTYYQARMPTLSEIEKDYILDVLKATDQNKTKAAKILGITIKTLYNKLHAYGMMPKKEIFPDYGKIEQAVLATHYKCIKAFSDGYGSDFRVGQYYQVVDMKQGYVLVRESFRRKPRWLKASRFEGV